MGDVMAGSNSKGSRLGSMSSLSSFSGITRQEQPKVEQEEQAPRSEQSQLDPSPPPPAPAQPKEKRLTTVNIKIRRDQHDWLNSTSRLVRENNADPVPPDQRVFPQHLIQVAIDLLQSAGVDWDQIRNEEELRAKLREVGILKS